MNRVIARFGLLFLVGTSGCTAADGGPDPIRLALYWPPQPAIKPWVGGGGGMTTEEYRDPRQFAPDRPPPTTKTAKQHKAKTRPVTPPRPVPPPLHGRSGGGTFKPAPDRGGGGVD